jgi:Flp pilus assembly pilin Flp
MKLFANIKNFAADESGAVTVDWVVLTAAIVGLGIAVIASVRTGTTDLATDIQTSLSGATVATLGELGVNN